MRTEAVLPLVDAKLETARVRGGAYVLTASGELDLHTVAPLWERLQSLAGQGPATVVADLSQVTFLDSTALGALAGGERLLRGRGGRLLVVTDDPRITMLLGLSGLDRFLEVHATMSAALEEVR